MRRDLAQREILEWVFMLTGGELNGEPWNGFAYNYDGVPEWASTDFPDRFDHEYRTVIGYFPYGSSPEVIVDGDGLWELQTMFESRGEAECPEGPDRVENERCPLCDESAGARHGWVYLGYGWAEAVYRLRTGDPDDDDPPDE